MKQGVEFLDWPFSEIFKIKHASEMKPFEPPIYAIGELVAAGKPDGRLPAMTGICLPGRNIIVFNTADLLDDFFVKQNASLTKSSIERQAMSMLAGQNVLMMDTFHRDYAKTRKVLSAAFFKQKLIAITKIIKEEVIEAIAQCQTKGEHEVDILDFWSEIQSQIFATIAVGRKNANIMCDYEQADGTIVKKMLSHMIRHLIEDQFNRFRNPIFLLIPELLSHALFPSCWRF